MQRKRAFTLIELLVVISIIALLIGILLPALGAARRTARQMQNSTQLRGIHQGMVVYSQSNLTYFPALSTSGALDAAVTGSYTAGAASATVFGINAMARLLNGNYFNPNYMYSPAENVSTTIQMTAVGAVTTANYSYSVLQITAAGEARAAEWKDNVSGAAAILSDRLLSSTGDDSVAGATADGTPANYRSIWTSNSGDWRGTVTMGDNSTAFQVTATITNTKYGSGALNASDDIFVGTATTDTTAKMIRN